VAANPPQNEVAEAAEEAAPPPSPPPKPDFTADDLLAHVPRDIRSVSFPVSVRGYERGAVDAYVKRVNRVIAELEVGRSPQAAVRHALDRVGQQTVAVLQEARESADRLLATAREEGDKAKEEAKAEAATLVVNASAEAEATRAEAEKVVADARDQASQIVQRAQAEAAKKLEETEQEIARQRAEAEARMRELEADQALVLNQRRELLDEVDAMAERLHELARAAASRVQSDVAAGANSKP
jgi:DivIVA domain-containing protein